MKTIKQLEAEKEKIEKQIQELKTKEVSNNQKLNILKKVTYKNKEFWIVEWTKQIKDFPYPKGFQMAEFNDFVELYDNKKIELEVWKYYFVKHFSKIQQKKKYCLSRLYLYGSLSLNSNNDGLAYSYDDGRVVIVREVKK